MTDSDINRYHNTFLFLRHTLYQTHGTYSQEEITKRLENSIPCVRTPQCGETGVTYKENSGKRQDKLAITDFVEHP